MKKKTKQKITKAVVAIALAVIPAVAQTVVEQLMSNKDPAPQITVIVIKK